MYNNNKYNLYAKCCAIITSYMLQKYIVVRILI